MFRFYTVKRIMLGQMIIIFLAHCTNPERKKDSTHDRTELVPEPDKNLREEYEKKQDISEITQTLNTFFMNYKSRLETVNMNLLSKDLATLITQAIAKEKDEVLKTANGSDPTDKPIILEGDIFTSEYERAEQFVLDSIIVEGKTARAILEFKNSKLKLNWFDEVVLIKQERWLIDNVVFKSSTPEYSSTKAVLEAFISHKE